MSKSKNKNLHKAKKAKNDEFYTQLSDIENELKHYKKHFKDKVVFCNCDDPEESNFWHYFSENFEHLGLKKLISTHFEQDKPSYKLEITKDENGDGKINKLDTVKTPLKQNGDFRSPECIEILKEADIVVTNPPFSLFREYVAQLIEYEKKFLIIGDINKATNVKDIFQYFLENKIWFGITKPKSFILPDGTIQKFGKTCWYTNFNHKKRNEEVILVKNYNEKDYPKYDNYDVIEVWPAKNIPVDYPGIMGVPISFLDKLNPEQFELLGMCNDVYWRGDCECLAKINGKGKYARLLIRNKKL